MSTQSGKEKQLNPVWCHSLWRWYCSWLLTLVRRVPWESVEMKNVGSEPNTSEEHNANDEKETENNHMARRIKKTDANEARF